MILGAGGRQCFSIKITTYIAGYTKNAIILGGAREKKIPDFLHSHGSRACTWHVLEVYQTGHTTRSVSYPRKPFWSYPDSRFMEPVSGGDQQLGEKDLLSEAKSLYILQDAG